MNASILLTRRTVVPISVGDAGRLFANDRPPVVGTIGRETGKVRLCVTQDTNQRTLKSHVEQFTGEGTHIYTDEYDSYKMVQRPRSTVAHGKKEWVRDDDGDGVREVHTNTIEGMWTGLRNFLRLFRDVSKHFLSGYVAIHEFRVNHKRVSPDSDNTLLSSFAHIQQQKLLAAAFDQPDTVRAVRGELEVGVQTERSSLSSQFAFRIEHRLASFIVIALHLRNLSHPRPVPAEFPRNLAIAHAISSDVRIAPVVCNFFSTYSPNVVFKIASTYHSK